MLSELIHLMCKEEDQTPDLKKKWDYHFQYRIISTNGGISELNTRKTFIDLNIKNNETLILLFPEKVCFSDILKGNMIFVFILFKNFSLVRK